MRTIRASEIGTYIYCQRAWWYRKQGHESQNFEDLAEGRELHYRHGRQIYAAGCLRTLAFLLMALAVAAAAIYGIEALL